MAETLLNGSKIWLFGRTISDLHLGDGGSAAPSATSAAAQNSEVDKGAGASEGPEKLARIYAFGFEGHLVQLARPAIFRVHGDGDPDAVAKAGLATDGLVPPKDWSGWQYDRADMTLRLDMMTGTFDSVLIDYELGTDGLQGYVRGGSQVGAPTPLGVSPRRGRGRRWRADDE